jgi:hypothetical protein
LAEITGGIKGASAQLINRELDRSGSVWQTESFDRVLRSSESLDAKVAYILDNPVRAGLVSKWDNYAWTWKRLERHPYAVAWPPRSARLDSRGGCPYASSERPDGITHNFTLNLPASTTRFRPSMKTQTASG